MRILIYSPEGLAARITNRSLVTKFVKRKFLYLDYVVRRRRFPREKRAEVVVVFYAFATKEMLVSPFSLVPTRSNISMYTELCRVDEIMCRMTKRKNRR